MAVVDAAGDDVGTVSAVQLPDTDVRPDVVTPDAEFLMGVGYLRINGEGALATDAYAGGHEVAEVSDDRITLSVLREVLQRASA